jgi:viroplasmin and RNaseH domain-containing protein
MEESNAINRDEVYSKKIKAGKRTYFFDVKATRGNDYYVTITESKRRPDGYGYEKHKIFLYKEDFNKFLSGLNEVVSHVKDDLMPDFDFEKFDRSPEGEHDENADFESGFENIGKFGSLNKQPASLNQVEAGANGLGHE